MRKTLLIFVLAWGAIYSVSPLPSLAQSAGERVRIDFLSTEDWIEARRVEQTPEKLEVGFRALSGVIIPIATFSQDGPSSPELVSVFKGSERFRATIFMVVKWHYYLPGVDTDGDYYEVHAYVAQKSGDEVKFSESMAMSSAFGAGFDGRQDGRYVRFPFKDAASIRKKLKSLGGH